MHKQGGLRRWVLLSLLTAGACEQQLALPRNDRAPVDAVAGATTEGFTGTAGAPDASDFAETLPVVDLPIYTHFAGAGGEGGAPTEVGDPREVARGGSSAAGSLPHEHAPNRAGAGTSDGGSGGAPPDPSGPPSLIFSEYVEGSGSYKALEIYALAPSSLEGCELRTYANGEADGAARLALHGALAPGEVHVLCSSSLAMTYPDACDRATSVNFNGDDALELACNDTVLDVFGQIGSDPGTAWGDGATSNHTLRRRCSVGTGWTDGKQPFDPSAEWLMFPTDTFTGLGEHTCTAPPLTADR